MRLRNVRLTGWLTFCLLVSLMFAPVRAFAEPVQQDGEYDSQEIGVSVGEDDESATSSAATLVTAVIVAPSKPTGPDPSPTDGSTATGILSKMGDDEALLAAVATGLISAAVLMLGLLAHPD